MLLNSLHVKITGTDMSVLLPTGAELLEVIYSADSHGIVFVYSSEGSDNLSYVRRYKLVAVGNDIPEPGNFLRYFHPARWALYDVTDHKDSILKEVERVFTEAGIEYKIYQNVLITPYGQYDLFTGRFQVGEHRGVGIYTFINRNRDCNSQGN